jgi:hypothetical protein
MEAELGEGFLEWLVSVGFSHAGPGLRLYLLVDVELPEDLGGIQEMRVVNDPTYNQHCSAVKPRSSELLTSSHSTRGAAG